MNKMKKLTAILLTMLLLLGLTACKGGDKIPDENLPEEVATPVEEPVEVTDEAEPVEEPAEEEAAEEPAEEAEDVVEEEPAEEEAEEVVEEEPSEEEADEVAEEEPTEEEAEEVAEKEPAEEVVEEEPAEEVVEEEPAEEVVEEEPAEEEADEVAEEEPAEEEADEVAEEEPTEEEADEVVEEEPTEEEAEAEDTDEPAKDIIVTPEERFLFQQGLRIFDITGLSQVSVDNAIVAANFDPEALMQGLTYLDQSGILGQIGDEVGGESLAELEDSGMAFLDQLPIEAALRYLDQFNINLYTIAFFDFDDAEAAERAFYTGEGIVSLNDEEKAMLQQTMQELKGEVVKLALQDPEGAEEIYDLFQLLISQKDRLAQPEWLNEEAGRLTRTWSIELPVGTFFIEEAQKDERVYLILSIVSSHGDEKIRAFNEGLGLFEVSPSFAIGEK